MPDTQKNTQIPAPTKPAVASVDEPVTRKPSLFQRLRGLQQYQRQQERKDPVPNDDDARAQSVKFGFTHEHQVEPAIEQKSEQNGLHALDHFFARELGEDSLSGAPQVQDQAQALQMEEQKAPVQAKADQARQSAQYGTTEPLTPRQVPIKKVTAAPLNRAPVAAKDNQIHQAPQVAAGSQAKAAPQKPANWQASSQHYQNPYQKFVSELDNNEIQYLLDESNATLQALLLKNASRRERSRILQQMPRQKRTELLRSLARSKQKLDDDASLRAFHWLSRKLEQRQHFYGIEVEESYPEISGTRVLSNIIDSLLPEQEEQLLRSVMRDDRELATWLERERGSAQQRQILRRISNQVSDIELALLFRIPRYGRLLRHLLNSPQKIAVLNAIIDLNQLPQERCREIEGELFARFPILTEC